jgi:hypothetical protein
VGRAAEVCNSTTFSPTMVNLYASSKKSDARPPQLPSVSGLLQCTLSVAESSQAKPQSDTRESLLPIASSSYVTSFLTPTPRTNEPPRQRQAGHFSATWIRLCSPRCRHEVKAGLEYAGSISTSRHCSIGGASQFSSGGPIVPTEKGDPVPCWLGDRIKMSTKQPTVSASPAESSASSDRDSLTSKRATEAAAPPLAPALASQETQRMESVLGDTILRLLRIRKGPRREQYDLDAVRIRQSP